MWTPPALERLFTSLHWVNILSRKIGSQNVQTFPFALVYSSSVLLNKHCCLKQDGRIPGQQHCGTSNFKIWGYAKGFSTFDDPSKQICSFYPLYVHIFVLKHSSHLSIVQCQAILKYSNVSIWTEEDSTEPPCSTRSRWVVLRVALPVLKFRSDTSIGNSMPRHRPLPNTHYPPKPNTSPLRHPDRNTVQQITLWNLVHYLYGKAKYLRYCLPYCSYPNVDGEDPWEIHESPRPANPSPGDS